VRTTQKVALRALQAVEQCALGVRGRSHFRTTEFDSIEGKKNDAGLRFKAGALEWFGLRLPILLDPVDRKAWQAEALRRSTKFCRVLRRRVRGVDRWYVQLAQEGRSPLVPATLPGAVVGLDLGPSTVAVVGEHRSAPAWSSPGRKRSAWSGRWTAPAAPPAPTTSTGAVERRRAPESGSGPGATSAWPRSGANASVASAAERKRVHGELANRIVGQGNVVKTEKISSVAFPKSFGRSVKVRAPGGLVAVLRQKTAATGGDLVEFPTRTTRLRVRSHDRYLHEEASLPAGPCARGWIGRGAARSLQRLPGALR